LQAIVAGSRKLHRAGGLNRRLSKEKNIGELKDGKIVSSAEVMAGQNAAEGL